MDELVSVIIPAYNAERWISDTIKSALSQTWQRKEIIIVNDGSTDNTLGIARQFESKSVKIITQMNSGANAARNKGLEFAQGDYIQWLDADDILAPDKISQQLKHINGDKSGRVLFSGAWSKFFFRTAKARFKPSFLWQDLEPVEWIFRKMNDNVWMTVESWLVSRKLTQLAGPWNPETYEDGEYFCRVVSASERIKFVPEAKSYYRVGIPGSMNTSIGKSDKILEFQFLSIYLQTRCLLSLEDSERTRKACLRYLQNWLIYFYPEKTSILEKANNLAKELGGKLSPPALKWRYYVIKQVFGWKMAKRALLSMPEFKVRILRNWDKLLYKFSI